MRLECLAVGQQLVTLVIAPKNMADVKVRTVAPASTAARSSLIAPRVTAVESLTAAPLVMGQRFLPGDLARGWSLPRVDSLYRCLVGVLLVLVFSEHLDVPCNLVNTACRLLTLVFELTRMPGANDYNWYTLHVTKFPSRI